ncbi:hypothetical protein TNCT_310891 [Trichonephila clavata]|uniref:Uncharacterized protein n=1 Tax=Trichonephila clavata TaxID=2740835 RepID=A0A8X6HJB2_TRICU|nr:hypothetical protein TNCT_310891 [Trichonephila clavata]
MKDVFGFSTSENSKKQQTQSTSFDSWIFGFFVYDDAWPDLPYGYTLGGGKRDNFPRLLLDRSSPLYNVVYYHITCYTAVVSRDFLQDIFLRKSQKTLKEFLDSRILVEGSSI